MSLSLPYYTYQILSISDRVLQCSLFLDRELTIGCAAQRPKEYPVDSQLASRSLSNSEETLPAAAMTSVASALEMNSPEKEKDWLDCAAMNRTETL